ncbi:MAG: hypothetical protein ACM3TU_03180 [Bacillota bacterium]
MEYKKNDAERDLRLTTKEALGEYARALALIRLAAELGTMSSRYASLLDEAAARAPYIRDVDQRRQVYRDLGTSFYRIDALTGLSWTLRWGRLKLAQWANISIPPKPVPSKSV